MLNGRITLAQFLIEEQRTRPVITGDLCALLHNVSLACKAISNAVSRGALGDMLGSPGSPDTTNVHGEVQKKLDLLSNDVMLRANAGGGHVAGMASEEMDDIRTLPTTERQGRYLLVFDPLDGSSNIDANITVGTIFSVLRAPEGKTALTAEDFLQPGTEQVCSGFALYGPATLLVLTTGNGVNGFTLDREIGAFVLTHPCLRIPEDTQEFAINASNERFWEPPVRRYVQECLAGFPGPRGKDFNMRWIASLVAETFRILTRGGIFLYPLDDKTRDRGGRLRLLYEANPIAFIVEQAGGAATTGWGRVMECRPEGLHQRVPLIFGSRREVDRITRYHEENAPNTLASFESPLFSARSLFRHR